MPNSDESRTITSQVTQEFYDRFQLFCFESEISKSDAIRESLEAFMKFYAFVKAKNKRDGGR